MREPADMAIMEVWPRGCEALNIRHAFRGQRMEVADEEFHAAQEFLQAQRLEAQSRRVHGDLYTNEERADMKSADVLACQQIDAMDGHDARLNFLRAADEAANAAHAAQAGGRRVVVDATLPHSDRLKNIDTDRKLKHDFSGRRQKPTRQLKSLAEYNEEINGNSEHSAMIQAIYAQKSSPYN
jgi:hypothetical protein